MIVSESSWKVYHTFYQGNYSKLCYSIDAYSCYRYKYNSYQNLEGGYCISSDGNLCDLI